MMASAFGDDLKKAYSAPYFPGAFNCADNFYKTQKSEN